MPDNIQEIVLALRTGRGWSQQELAKYAGLSRQFISKIENGRQVPGTDTVQSLAEAFGLSMGEFWSTGLNGSATGRTCAKTLANSKKGGQ